MAESPDTRLLSETNARQISVVRGEQYQDIRSHGAKCDGVTDDLDAFTKAFAAGRRVFVPAGVTRVRSAVLVPSNSELFGAGMDVSTIKLTDNASANTWVVTNSTRSIGNTNITVHDLTLDWNQPRQGGLDSTGGSRSSCLTFGNVQHGLVERVKAVNPGNHGFDVTSAAENYPYSGDGSPNATGPSRHVTIRDCVATGWGDDGFTTHHSEFITIENCYGYSPRKRANCNAFEVDDGSRDVTLINNRSAFCYGGVEIKAHADAPAATRVVVRGHRSYRDVLGLHVRHIGHIIATDATSLSAYDVEVHNFTVVEPGNRYGFQEETQAYAADIGSYRNILVDGFTAIADPAYDMAGNAPFLLRYMVNNGQFRNLKFRGFTTSTYDVYVTGGNNKADRVTIDGVDSYKSAQQVVGVGTGNPMVSIDNVNAVAPDAGASYAINVGFSNANANVGKSINLVGYPTAIRHNGINYPSIAAFERRVNDLPAGVTRLVDLDPTMDYYVSSTPFATLTDAPVDQGGGNWVTHSRVTGFVVIQTVTRNSSSGGLQRQAWRVVDYSAKTAGPWNKVSRVSIDGVLPAGGTPPAEAAAGTVWLVRNA